MRTLYRQYMLQDACVALTWDQRDLMIMRKREREMWGGVSI